MVSAINLIPLSNIINPIRPSDPRRWELASPTTLPFGSTHNQARGVAVSPLPGFDFTHWAIEPRSKIMFMWFGAETRFSVTAESNGMLCIPLQRNIM